ILVRTMHGDQPTLLAQFDCNENCANMGRDGRALVGCLHLTSPMVRVWKPKPTGCTPIAPWYLRDRPLRFKSWKRRTGLVGDQERNMRPVQQLVGRAAQEPPAHARMRVG